MSAGPRIGSYAWPGGREAVLRFGPEQGPQVVLALPLFEEANRTRAFGCAILRALAASGIGCALPDLPGQGESLIPTEQASLADLRAAFAAVAEGTFALGIRSAALLHAEARLAGRWLLSPQSGGDLRRELARVAAGPLDGADSVEIAGNLVSRTLLNGLAAADPAANSAPTRVVRLTGDPRPADRHVDAAPLWRRAEPDGDVVLAQTLAADIAEWIVLCGD